VRHPVLTEIDAPNSSGLAMLDLADS